MLNLEKKPRSTVLEIVIILTVNVQLTLLEAIWV